MGHHHHHHHHHNRTMDSNLSSHYRRDYRGHRDPSVHSISSSEISSEASTIVHKRSSPKIAAAIIAAILIISGLIATTIYLVSTNKLGFHNPLGGETKDTELNHRFDTINKEDSDKVLDYQTYHDESARLLSDVSPNNDDHTDMDSIYLNQFESYDDVEDSLDRHQKPQLDIHGKEEELSRQFYKNLKELKEESGVDLFGVRDFTDDQEVTYDDTISERIDEPKSDNEQHYMENFQDERPYGTRLRSRINTANKHVELYNMEPYRNNAMNYNRRRRPYVNNRKTMIENRKEMVEELLKEDSSDDDYSILPSGSRGGIRVPVSTEEEDLDSSNIGSLTTVDRRPGRPAFHHLGPIPNRQQQILRRRFMRPNLRRNQGFSQRFGYILEDKPKANPVEEAKEILSNFDSYVALAESEVEFLKKMVKNITENGKPINLKEIIIAVNNTIKDNPDSPISRLMNRFYNTYLMEEEMEANEAAPTPTYSKSLSSLLFLSFGIFLLNSVNSIIAKNQLEQSRTFNNDVSSQHFIEFEKLLSQHPQLEGIFNLKSEDFDNLNQDRSIIENANSANNINNYLRLLMNLMNVYNSENEEMIDCIWSLYCHQLNRQAELGGMISTVARMNSVGMKVILNNVSTRTVLPAVVKSMIQWQDLKCGEMFPKCTSSTNDDS